MMTAEERAVALLAEWKRQWPAQTDIRKFLAEAIRQAENDALDRAALVVYPPSSLSSLRYKLAGEIRALKHREAV